MSSAASIPFGLSASKRPATTRRWPAPTSLARPSKIASRVSGGAPSRASMRMKTRRAWRACCKKRKVELPSPCIMRKWLRRKSPAKCVRTELSDRGPRCALRRSTAQMKMGTSSPRWARTVSTARRRKSADLPLATGPSNRAPGAQWMPRCRSREEVVSFRSQGQKFSSPSSVKRPSPNPWVSAFVSRTFQRKLITSKCRPVKTSEEAELRARIPASQRRCSCNQSSARNQIGEWLKVLRSKAQDFALDLSQSGSCGARSTSKCSLPQILTSSTRTSNQPRSHETTSSWPGRYRQRPVGKCFPLSRFKLVVWLVPSKRSS
mmetsp:Transcript_24786/g.56107  ORF Transcript_24786/g.56107 Transcript_24786/m.56107 type:complete len:320 (-) Transcript_24786:83-1042(-)